MEGPPSPGSDGPWYTPPGFAPSPPRRPRRTALLLGLAAGSSVVALATLVVVAIMVDAPVEEAARPRWNAPKAAPAGYRTIDGIGYSYAVPSAWEEIDAASLGSPLVSHAQRAPIPVGHFSTNVNVAQHAYVGDGPGFAVVNLTELRKSATIRDQHASSSGARPAWDVEAHWPSTAGIPHVTLQRYVGNGQTGFILTCSAAAAVFASQRPICEIILSTFQVE